ncbi:hypothetical protein ACISU4_34995 [Streptomyces wuyuanensis]|uniref:hypothetical protein n=1 Tax=Streptomyces wuyuanensis TaxID=1196353 RepID=UPI00381C7D7B
MSGRRSLVWLGLTPEPERELPLAVAALRTRARVASAAVRDPAASERRRVERLILHGSERSWLRYLAEVTDLVTSVADGTSTGDPRAALVAGEVVLDHHRMLIGLPGAAYDRTAQDRSTLETAVRTLRATAAGNAPRAGDAPETVERAVAERRLHAPSDEAHPARHRLASSPRATAAGNPPEHPDAAPPGARRPSAPAPSAPAPSTPIPDGDRT